MKDVKSILVFDFETTGFYPNKNDVIEIGAVKYANIKGKFVQTDELSVLVRPNEPIPAKITEITNITNEMVEKDGVSQDEAFQRLSLMIDEDTLLIAYNIQFDLGFLEALYRRFYSPTFVIKNNILDVMAVYKDRHRYPHRLETAIKTYRINIPNSHRASDDAKATYAVLQAMQLELDTISKYINVVGYNIKYGVSGKKLKHVNYVPQYGGRREIEKM